MTNFKFPETLKETKEFLQAITPMKVEHIFLDTFLWDNSSIRVNVAFAYSEFENETYLIVSLYDVKERKILSEVIWPAGFDERKGKIMTSVENDGSEVCVMYGGDTDVWLQSEKKGEISLVAKRGKEIKKFPITGLEAYPEDF